MKIKRAFFTILIIGLFSVFFTGTAFAAGGAYVSDEYIELEAGKDTYVSLTFDNAAGRFSVSSSGSVYANEDEFLDNDSYGIGITSTGIGYGTVTINLYDVATFDDKDLSGEEIVIEVNVYEPEDGDTDYGKGQDENAPDDVKTNENKTDSKSGKLDVKIDEKEYTVLTDFTGVDLPKGFTEAEETLEGEKVKVLQYKDSIKLYALKNKSDKTVIFYNYDEATKKFTKPLSMTQGKKTYYFLDVPADTQVAGYQKKEVTINGEKMPALISDYAGMEDYAYVYAMSDGEESFYCIDEKENTIQRVSKFSIPIDDHEKQLVAKKVSIFDKKYILVGGAVALALIIFFLIMWLVTRRKYKEAQEDDFDMNYESNRKDSTLRNDKKEEYNDDYEDSIDYVDTIDYEEIADNDFDDISFDDLK